MHVFCSNVMHNIFMFLLLLMFKMLFFVTQTRWKHKKFSLQNNLKIALKLNSLCTDTQKSTFTKSYLQKKPLLTERSPDAVLRDNFFLLVGARDKGTEWWKIIWSARATLCFTLVHYNVCITTEPSDMFADFLRAM